MKIFSTKKEDILRHKKWKIWLTSNMSTFSTLPVTRRKRRSWKKNKLHYISQSVYSFALKAIVNSIERLDGLLVRAIWYHGNLDRIFVRKTLNCSAENSLKKTRRHSTLFKDSVNVLNSVPLRNTNKDNCCLNWLETDRLDWKSSVEVGKLWMYNIYNYTSTFWYLWIFQIHLHFSYKINLHTFRGAATWKRKP